MSNENRPNSSLQENTDSNQRFDRRSKPRPDPYDTLVRNENDIIGLIAYSIFRQKKKRLLESDPDDRSRHFFFDATIGQYEEELREKAYIWYNKFCETIEKECSEKHINETRSYINLKFDEIIGSQKKFKWVESILSSVAASFTYVFILAFTMLYLSLHSKIIDLIAYTMDFFGITFRN